MLKRLDDSVVEIPMSAGHVYAGNLILMSATTVKRKADSNQAAVIDTEVDRPDIVLTLHQECTYNAAYAWVHQGFDTEILQEGLSAEECDLFCFRDHWGVFRSEAVPR